MSLFPLPSSEQGYSIYDFANRIPGRNADPQPIIFAYISLNLATLSQSGLIEGPAAGGGGGTGRSYSGGSGGGSYAGGGAGGVAAVEAAVQAALTDAQKAVSPGRAGAGSQFTACRSTPQQAWWSSSKHGHAPRPPGALTDCLLPDAPSVPRP